MISLNRHEIIITSQEHNEDVHDEDFASEFGDDKIDDSEGFSVGSEDVRVTILYVFFFI